MWHTGNSSSHEQQQQQTECGKTTRHGNGCPDPSRNHPGLIRSLAPPPNASHQQDRSPAFTVLPVRTLKPLPSSSRTMRAPRRPVDPATNTAAEMKIQTNSGSSVRDATRPTAAQGELKEGCMVKRALLVTPYCNASLTSARVNVHRPPLHTALQPAAQRTRGGIAAAAAAARHLGAARLRASPRLENGAHQANCSSEEAIHRSSQRHSLAAAMQLLARSATPLCRTLIADAA